MNKTQLSAENRSVVALHHAGYGSTNAEFRLPLLIVSLGCNMKNFFVGAYSCLAVATGLMALAALLSLFLSAFSVAWGLAGLFLAVVAGACAWLACGCRTDDHQAHA